MPAPVRAFYALLDLLLVLALGFATFATSFVIYFVVR